MAVKINKPRGERIRRLLETAELKPQQLADRMKVSVQSVYSWQAGKPIKPQNVERLAEIFKVSENYIYRGIAGDGVQFLGNASVRSIPQISLDTVAIQEFDTFMAQVENSEHYTACRFSTGERVYAFRLLDDSNAPVYREGDLIIVDPDISPEPGEYVLALVNKSEYVFRRYKLDEKGFALAPANPDYPTVHSRNAEVVIFGVMTEFARQTRR